ncbi:MAG: general secretion pathway protein L [Cryomorphaceae bacterium]
MQDRVVVRLIEDQLVWYPPGMNTGAQSLGLEDALDRLLLMAAEPRANLCFAAPGTDVTLLRVEFSQAEKKHINKALPFALEEQLVSDIDDLHFSTQLLDQSTLCAAICDKQKMGEWQEILAYIPNLNQWIPEAQLLPWEEGQWTIVLEENYALVRSGACEGFSVERSSLANMLQALVHETQEMPSAVVVYGQDQNIEKVLLPDSLIELMQWRHGDFRTAMMLAQDNNPAVNLLQGAFGQRLPLQRWWREWRLVAAVFFGAFCLQLIAGYANFLSLEQQNIALRQEAEKSARQVFPRGVLNQPEKQIERELNSLKGTAQSSGFVHLISRVGEVVAKKPGARIDSINYNDKGDEMRINLTAKNYEDVEAIRTAMTNLGLQAVMENSNAQGDQVRARLRVGAKS